MQLDIEVKKHKCEESIFLLLLKNFKFFPSFQKSWIFLNFDEKKEKQSHISALKNLKLPQKPRNWILANFAQIRALVIYFKVSHIRRMQQIAITCFVKKHTCPTLCFFL